MKISPFGRKITRRLKKLKILKKATKAGGVVDQRYDYDERLYAFSRECANSTVPRSYMRALGDDPDNHDLPAFFDAFINKASSSDDRRVRWKQASALKFAAMKNVKPPGGRSTVPTPSRSPGIVPRNAILISASWCHILCSLGVCRRLAFMASSTTIGIRSCRMLSRTISLEATRKLSSDRPSQHGVDPEASVTCPLPRKAQRVSEVGSDSRKDCAVALWPERINRPS
jgi:hypothetical protein